MKVKYIKGFGVSHMNVGIGHDWVKLSFVRHCKKNVNIRSWWFEELSPQEVQKVNIKIPFSSSRGCCVCYIHPSGYLQETGVLIILHNYTYIRSMSNILQIFMMDFI